MPRPVIDELLKNYFFYFWNEAINEIRFCNFVRYNGKRHRGIIAINKAPLRDKKLPTFTGRAYFELSPLGGKKKSTENKTY